jgi:transposase
MKELLTDELWRVVEPLLPEQPAHPKGGRPRVKDRVALRGILYVLRTGIQWEMLPQEMGCSGMTCWRRLRDWQQAGVWQRLHEVLLQRLHQAGKIDWSRASIDAASVQAPGGAQKQARTRRTGVRREVSITSLWRDEAYLLSF